MLENLNQYLFLLLNAPAHPSGLMLAFSWVAAEYVIFIVPVYLVSGWLLSETDNTKKQMLQALFSGLLALLIAQATGHFLPHPRPFMLEMGTNFLPHLPDPSFPSDHVTLILAVAFSLTFSATTRIFGAALLAVGLLVAWARIYLGVHFPFDMAGAFIIGLCSALLVQHIPDAFADGAYAIARNIYRKAFSALIKRGWLA